MTDRVMARLRQDDWVRFRKVTECESVSAIALFRAVVDLVEEDSDLRKKILDKAAEYRMPWGGYRSLKKEVAE